MSFTCSSNQVHNSADSFESFAKEVASPSRAQGMRYCNKAEKSMVQPIGRTLHFFNWFTLPFISVPCGDTPAHNCVNAPDETGCRMATWNFSLLVNDVMRVRGVLTIKKYSKRETWRCRSDLMFPGLREVETMPCSPYRVANSFDTWIFPCELMWTSVKGWRERKKRTSLLWQYNFWGPFFVLAGLSLKVLKSRPLANICADEDVLTMRAFPSGLVLAAARRGGTRSFVK